MRELTRFVVEIFLTQYGRTTNASVSRVLMLLACNACVRV